MGFCPRDGLLGAGGDATQEEGGGKVRRGGFPARAEAGSPRTGMGRRGCLAFRACRGSAGKGAPRAGREGESAPGLGSSSFRTSLSLVRTGRGPVPTAQLPQLCSPGKDVEKQERTRDWERQICGETQRQTQREKSVKSIETDASLREPWALWEAGGPVHTAP